jgi:hypothetical protein
MTFELVDLQDLGEKAVQDFTAHVSKSQPPHSAAAVAQAIEQLVGKVQFAYGVAAKLAHREPTVEGTSAIWSKMVAICDDIARQIKQLEGAHPSTRAALDRILDYRNAADRRRELHS